MTADSFHGEAARAGEDLITAVLAFFSRACVITHFNHDAIAVRRVLLHRVVVSLPQCCSGGDAQTQANIPTAWKYNDKRVLSAPAVKYLFKLTYKVSVLSLSGLIFLLSKTLTCVTQRRRSYQLSGEVKIAVCLAKPHLIALLK